jgi:pyruvate ferredoxin oxidoreductase beta subunit
MIGKYPVFAPKILPREEYFVSGRRSCKGCGKALSIRMICKVMGKEVISTDVPFASSSLASYTHTGVGLTWDEVISGDLTSSLVDRVIAEHKKAYHGQEWKKEIKKPVIGIDRRIFSKDLLALTEVLKEQKNVVYVCYDSEMYMDNLFERIAPSLEPHSAHHPLGKDEVQQFVRDKTVPPLLWESMPAYIATCCPSYPLDLMEKIKKGLNVSGTAFINVLTPCPTGWMFNPDRTVYLGTLAVTTGFYPLFEVEEGRIKVTERVSPLRPLTEYFRAQQRYTAFPPDITSLIQEAVREEYESLVADK